MNLIAAAKVTGDKQKIRLMSLPWHDEEMDYHIAPVLIILFSDTRTKVALPDMGKRYSDKTRSIFNSILV